MNDNDLAVPAFLAYSQAVLRENGGSRNNIESIEDALDRDVLHIVAGIDGLGRQYDSLQVLKIVYHRLLSTYQSAYQLPYPELDALVTPKPSPSEFGKLYTIILLGQAVWSEANSRYVGVIQGLEQKYQECLKDVIERALTSLPEDTSEESFSNERGDVDLVQADLTYRIQKHVSEAQTRLVLSQRELQAARQATTYEPQSSLPDRPLTKRRSRPTGQSAEQFHFTLGDSESDSEERPEQASPPRDDGAPVLSTSSTPRVTANERIKELEIETLQAELNDKADELRQLEIQLEESRETVQAYVHRIAELEASVEEIDRLRDEVEIHRHATEKLRKSENVVDKLKRKLDAVSDVRSEMLALENQVKTLKDENVEWESKYTELIRSRNPHSVSLATTGIPESDSHVSELSVRVEQLEIALQAKEIEVTQLKEMSSELAQSAFDDATSSFMSEDENVSPVKSRKRAEPLVSESPLSPELDQKLRLPRLASPESLGTKASLRKRVTELETLLAKAATASKSDGLGTTPAEPSQLGAAETGNLDRGSMIALEHEIVRLKDSLAETDMRYRTEKLVMLKAWTDLGQRAMKMSAGGNGGSGSGAPETGVAGRPVELSWASRVRRQIHTVPERKAST